jgi:hypothetical protein
MSRHEVASADPRHDRGSSGSGGAVLFLLLGLGLVVVLGVGGGVAYFMLRSTQQAERAALVRAEEAQARSDRATAAAFEQLEQVNPIPVDLSTIAVEKADRLRGRTVMASYDLLDNDDGRGGFTVYSDIGRDDDDDNSVERSVWIPRGKKLPMKGTAIGALRVIRHSAAVGAEGTQFRRGPRCGS